MLKWIQSNRKFISNNLEELFASYSAYFKFAAYLIFLTCEKVEADLNFITEDDVFLHLIDEILSYDNDFLNLLPELVNCKRPIDILSNNEEHVDRWIKIEFVSAAQTYVLSSFFLTCLKISGAWAGQFQKNIWMSFPGFVQGFDLRVVQDAYYCSENYG